MIEVPEEARSTMPARLRTLALSNKIKAGTPEQALLVEAAAEIEGSEIAYAVLVSQIKELRAKVARMEANRRY